MFWWSAKIHKLKILWGETDERFGTRSPRYGIWRVLYMSDSLSSVWDHSVYLQNFHMLRFSKGYCSHTFHLISTKLCCTVSVFVMTEYRLLIFLEICQVKEKMWQFIFVSIEHIGLEISKRYSFYSFDPIWDNVYDKYGSHEGI